jgi:hypothetical protein
MAAAAVLESQIPAKRTLTVMASEATLPAAGSKMLKRDRRADLPRLGQSRTQRVAIDTR